MQTWCAPLPGHTVVRVRGEDPLGFLEATTTQDVKDLKPGQGALACLLDDKGHVLSEFRVLPMPDATVVLDGEPAAREALTGWLARVAPLSGCEVLDESGRWVARHVGDGPPQPQEHSFTYDGNEIRIGVRWGHPGYDELGPSLPLNEIRAEEVERARIEAGRTRFGIDVTPEMILNETPLLDRVASFTKGCYPGQETVAKIRNLGRPRRSFVVLRASAPVQAGAQLEGGRITSASGDVALAFVRAELADRTEIDVDGVRAQVTKIE